MRIIPPSLNDFNLPPNLFNILATMAVVNQEHDNNYRPQSPEPSEPSPVTTPPMNVSTFDRWETSHTTTDDNTFPVMSPGEFIFSHQALHHAVTSAQGENKTGDIMSFPKRRGISQHVCEACGQMIPSAKDIPGPSTKN